MGKAKECYPVDQINNDFIQSELVSIFKCGLQNHKVTMRVVGKNVATLQRAVAIVLEADEHEMCLLAHGFSNRLERTGEDMDITQVSILRPIAKDKQGKFTSSSGGNAQRAKFTSGSGGSPNQWRSRPLPNKWENGCPIFNQCHKLGHLLRNCPDRVKVTQGMTRLPLN